MTYTLNSFNVIYAACAFEQFLETFIFSAFNWHLSNHDSNFLITGAFSNKIILCLSFDIFVVVGGG